MLSVITLARDRNTMLSAFLRGWAEQDRCELEVVVVRAGGTEDPHDVAEQFSSLRVRHVALSSDLDDVRIAYSHARNAGARAAHGNHLVFCDADTIATPRAGVRLHEALDDVDGLLTGHILYLPPDADVSRPITELTAIARPHRSRPVSPRDATVDLSLRHEMVWGLCMALRSTTFHQAGGFDEHYLGYAGEDTDLARAVARSGRPAGTVGGADILHQHHDSFEPPLHQLDATLLNARRYHSKWGVWPMEGWLAQFEQLGLITRYDDHIVVERHPTDAEIEMHRCRAAAPFRSAPRQRV